MTGLTNHQAKLFAPELLRRHPNGDTRRIGTALLDAQVDLNPHQVDAALFAFQSPLSKGVILADEVGLGKTIEAGLVLTQRWAEGRRRVLVVAPASLRKQWVQELAEKFFLPAVILETKSFNAAVKAGVMYPFDGPANDRAVVVCSYQFAARKAEEVSSVRWDLAILDEAHRLRNVYKPGAKIATAIRNALSTTPKLLLTATPLQNSLMELYGLVSIIDEHHFGDVKSFRAQYSRLAEGGRFDDLKARLEPVCHRTLRRQVVEYVSYTNRVPITQEFLPSAEEQALYDLVSDYLRRPELRALPAGQRTLMVLVMRKLLASSTFAIAGALDSLVRKLQGVLLDDDRTRTKLAAQLDDAFDGDFEELPELAEEWGADQDEPEDHLILTAVSDNGTHLDQEQTRRLLDVPASICATGPVELTSKVLEIAERRLASVLEEISMRQGTWFEEEMEKLDRWAEDKRTGLKANLREHDDTLKTLKRDARQAASLPDKLAIQKKIKQVETARDEAWRAYDTEARTIESAKEALIDDVEVRLAVDQSVDRVLSIRFTVR